MTSASCWFFSYFQNWYEIGGLRVSPKLSRKILDEFCSHKIWHLISAVLFHHFKSNFKLGVWGFPPNCQEKKCWDQSVVFLLLFFGDDEVDDLLLDRFLFHVCHLWESCWNSAVTEFVMGGVLHVPWRLFPRLRPTHPWHGRSGLSPQVGIEKDVFVQTWKFLD